MTSSRNPIVTSSKSVHDSSRPCISVITTTLNAAQSLEAAMASVFAQTYENVEYIVIDGGSTDSTLEIIKRHADQLRYWTSEPDAGIYDAMNKSLTKATGDWLYFLGSDDILADCLHKIAPALVDARTIYYGDVYMPGAHKLYGGPFGRYRLMFANICHQAMFYPRDLFTRYQYNPKYRLLADHALNMQCCGDHSVRFSYLPVLVALYNDIGGKSSKGFDVEFERDHSALVRANFPWYLYLIFMLRMTLHRLKARAMKTRKKRAS